MILIVKYDTATGNLYIGNVEILPAGDIGQLLRHNGTAWLAETMLLILSSGILRGSYYAGSYNGNSDKILLADSNGDYKLSEITGGSSNYYLNNRGFIVTIPGGQQIFFTRTGTATKALLDLKDLASGGQDIIRIHNSTIDLFRVLADGKILSNFLAGTGERVLATDANGNIIPTTLNVTMPVGTVGKILRHSGTGWVASERVTVSDSTLGAGVVASLSDYKSAVMFITPDTSGISLSCQTIYNNRWFEQVSFLSGHRIAMYLGDLQASAMMTITSDIIASNGEVYSVKTNNITRFSVKANGLIKSDSLTASTLLKSNSSKEIVSITNAAGYLKNDGSGGFSYDTPSGAPQVNADWDATSGVTVILHKPTIPSDVNDLTDEDGLLDDHLLLSDNTDLTAGYLIDKVESANENLSLEATGGKVRFTVPDVNVALMQASDLPCDTSLTWNSASTLIFNLKAGIQYELSLNLLFHSTNINDQVSAKFRLYSAGSYECFGIVQKSTLDEGINFYPINLTNSEANDYGIIDYGLGSSTNLNPFLAQTLILSSADITVQVQFKLAREYTIPPETQEVIILKANSYGILRKI